MSESTSPAASVSPTSRLLTALLGLAIGAAYGAIGTVAHQNAITVAGVPIPWGLVLALAGVTCLLVGLRMVVDDRFVVAAAAVGLIGMVFVLSLPSPGGSVLIPQSVAGVVWTIAPPLIAAVVLAWPRLDRAGAASAHA